MSQPLHLTGRAGSTTNHAGPQLFWSRENLSPPDAQLALPADVVRYWSDRHVVITGGTSGIGLVVTELALSAGARVSVLALEDTGLESLSAFAESEPRLAVFAADVTNKAQVDAAVAKARTHHGDIGAVIACAGIARPDYFDRLTDTDFVRHIAVNYFGALHVIQPALPDLRAGGRGSITVISSLAAVLPCFGYGAYSPSKSAVRTLCEVLRQELKPQGVTVTVVMPPDVDTPQLAAEAATKPAELQALSSSVPITATAVAEALLIGAARGRASVVPSRSGRLMHWLSAVAPRLMAWIMDRTIARVQRRDPH
ncbi:SDR family NAD(P)-dependent oxidoreductase [Nocardia colli]|uniref:SDR family NAD(P)-dependent oxidoreductase n=1 Tax=Nocardia colli TaxID=2545717 RepID=A0A5N0E7P2_9NOCA|nr:SDR family NAD(P)-dependent oxidoreductase [Nocardia colli]KAA8885448.1 SDR family NAD(P)-dependent oxidoreductase [Nocardia colli]